MTAARVRSPVVIGSLAAVLSATAYGVTVVIGRALARDGITGATALGVRFTLGAAILVALQAVRRAPVVPDRGERVTAFLLGAIGYAVESSCFYAALGRGSAAAVGLLFYSYPAIVTLLELVTGASRMSKRLLAALALAAVGVVVVIAAGAAVSISRAGVVFALLASLSFSLYFLASHRLMRTTDPITNAAWVSLGAGVSMLVRGLLTSDLHWPSGQGGTLLVYGIANAVAFGFMFAALRTLGPTRTAVILTFEVFATVVLAALFLDETLRPLQAVGGIAIAAGAVLVTLATPVTGDLDIDPPP